MMDSRIRLGGEKLSGAFTGATSSNGLIRFDGALNGPTNKAKGWYFSVGAYLNLDPTNVNFPSRTNLAYFDGHFETFAGADMKVDKHSVISLNVINVLGQTGAKGSIDAVDTVTDPAELQGILIAGTYIRPLSIELKYTYRF